MDSHCDQAYLGGMYFLLGYGGLWLKDREAAVEAAE